MPNVPTPPDSDATPVEPAIRRASSGGFNLNLAGALCARPECGCRRDAHRVDARGVAHECSCGRCSEFFIGGAPDYDKLPDTLPASSNPPPPTEKT